jgi:hypothetical protein
MATPVIRASKAKAMVSERHACYGGPWSAHEFRPYAHHYPRGQSWPRLSLRASSAARAEACALV